MPGCLFNKMERLRMDNSEVITILIIALITLEVIFYVIRLIMRFREVEELKQVLRDEYIRMSRGFIEIEDIEEYDE